MELLVITDSIMRDIFDWFFMGVSDVIYGYTKVEGCKALAPFLVQCTVNLFFSDKGYLPSSEELTEIAVQELKNGKKFHQEYLTRLREMKAKAFAAANDVVYISTQDELDAAMLAEQKQTESKSKDASSRLLTHVLPLVTVSVLLLLVGFAVIYRIRRTQRHWEHNLDPNENIMKHKDHDIEEGTTAGETYRISAFSEDETVTSDGFHPSYKKKNTKENLDKQMEQMIHDLEEVSLASSTSRISGKDSTDSDDSSVSGTPLPQLHNKTMTAVLEHSSKPAWATRGSTSHSVASRESSSGWTSQTESIASTLSAVQVQAKKTCVKQNRDDLLVRFENSDSPIFGETTEALATTIKAPSDSPNGEVVTNVSDTLNTNQLLSLPVLQYDHGADLDTDDLMAEVSSEIITSSDNPQIIKEIGLAGPVADSDIKNEDYADESIEKLTDGPVIDSTKPVRLAAKPKASTPWTNNATAPTATASDEAKMNKPDWTKARLRPVPKPAIIGTDENGSKESAPSSPQPEWMAKFKQMGLDKHLEDE